MRIAVVSCLLAGSLSVSGCSGEDATPIDLHGGQTTESTVDDPNAEVREQAKQLAAEQCFDDPDLDKGVIQFVDPDSGEVVGDVTADCEVVRSQQE